MQAAQQTTEKPSIYVDVQFNPSSIRHDEEGYGFPLELVVERNWVTPLIPRSEEPSTSFGILMDALTSIPPEEGVVVSGLMGAATSAKQLSGFTLHLRDGKAMTRVLDLMEIAYTLQSRAKTMALGVQEAEDGRTHIESDATTVFANKKSLTEQAIQQRDFRRQMLARKSSHRLVSEP